MTTGRLSLASYQKEAVEGLSGVVRKVAEFHESEGANQQEIALKYGVTLLQSPTGSGKTLVLGRVLEVLRGALSRPVVWLWFAPYAGLVSQTRDALVIQCGGLRVRDVVSDRAPAATRDGDVFIQTWATVAARNKNARRVRRTSESNLSLDDMLAELRDRRYFIGVVIDEAHLNFGASAKVAADFYLRHLRPDFTLLATATPNDDKLDAFREKAQIEVASRIIVPRSDVVAAGLNKVGLKLGIIRFRDGDGELIDHEQATLTAGWTQHKRICAELEERGIELTPLMLVQVEDQAKGEEDPVKRVRDKLIEIGVSENSIAIHTSGEPDPDFHLLAYDPDKQVLIFKVAVATGFDAPRAWTLVSVRPNRGKDFGLQIVGRIMRVHPAIRPIHGENALLDSGYVLLTDPEMQSGLQAAVDEIQTVRESIALITDQLDVYEFGSADSTTNVCDIERPLEEASQPPVDAADRQVRLGRLIEQGQIKADVADMGLEEQDRAILAGESLQRMMEIPLFPAEDLPVVTRLGTVGEVSRAEKGHHRLYPLRSDLDVPRALFRELPADPSAADEFVGDIAREFCRTAGLVALLQRRLTKATLDLRDLFTSEIQDRIDLRLRLSNARVADRAQLAFKFNDSVDPRLLKQALVTELRRVVDDQGVEAEERDLRRAIDLAAMMEPEKLKAAIISAQARRVRTDSSMPVPKSYSGPDGLAPAVKGAYGVFPQRLNREEKSFATFLDVDDTGTVKWWLRNPENESWATRLILPSGHRFFPDFVVGVKGRTTPDSIALVEIKDDGETGRLQSDRNVEKIRVQHREYRNVFWTYRENGIWVRARYAEGLHRIVPKDSFRIRELVYMD